MARIMGNYSPAVKAAPNDRYAVVTIAGFKFSMNKVESLDFAKQLLMVAERLELPPLIKAEDK
ncbi:hypothetical protein [Mycobacterium sp. 3-98]|uniref:hypothetical protein n=1 Tax=Mycobacterium sp. 3-98 TaxID=3042317 RepID=UPI002DD9FAE2|nr:hypothetical protein [Mycobacterium sp. 3-98]WSE45583.1 hypothetical protein QGN30_21100 [Mycobacterium sp. 3-98]